MEGYIGEIRIFAGTFAPMDWAFCQGQLLQISQYQALYSLLGTQYGGDGRVTFALPNLSGRVVVGTGVTREGTRYQNAQMGGKESSSNKPLVLIQDKDLNQETQKLVNTFGIEQTTSCMQPYMGLNYIICLNGLYPTRD
ncbi:MAG: phage tail protein [Sulfurovum sp.]|nr:MAG: phage tail protein [Sulfurovum sp.]